MEKKEEWLAYYHYFLMYRKEKCISEYGFNTVMHNPDSYIKTHTRKNFIIPMIMTFILKENGEVEYDKE